MYYSCIHFIQFIIVFHIFTIFTFRKLYSYILLFNWIHVLFNWHKYETLQAERQNKTK